eukprot:scaffold53485_cov12-Tisochrysis_lutea.AAC.1
MQALASKNIISMRATAAAPHCQAAASAGIPLAWKEPPEDRAADSQGWPRCTSYTNCMRHLGCDVPFSDPNYNHRGIVCLAADEE